MRPGTTLTAVACLVTLLSACVQTPKSPGATGADAVHYAYYTSEDFPVDLDHDHNDPTQHTAKFQIDFLAFHSCAPDGQYHEGQVGAFTDIAFWHEYAFVGKGNGFCILDVADPTHPKYVGAYLGEPAYDMEVTPDGNYAFLLTQRNQAPAAMGSTDATDYLPRGVIVVNVKDKSNPAFESYYPVPTNGVHTATLYQMDNRLIVAIQTYDWATPASVGPVPRENLPETQRVEITELKADATGKMALSRLSLYSLQRPANDQLALWFPHDSYIEKHPITGKVLLYISYWDAGMVIVDITNPSNPVFVSRYDDKAPSKYNAYHDIKSNPELIAGRHITVAGPELESAVGESGKYRVFDTTDPAKPVQLGTWGLPGVNGFAGGFQFSPHVFQIVDGRVFAANYHGGVWVFDIHNETLLRNPMTAGYYFPHGDETKDPSTWAHSETVWGVYYHEGYLYATEETQGVHVLKWAGDTWDGHAGTAGMAHSR